MINDCRRGQRLHRFRHWPNGFLGSVSGLPGREDHAPSAVAEMARRYRQFVEIFEHARSS